MTRKQFENRQRLLTNLARLGFTSDEAYALRRIEMTLSKWGEGECGDSNDFCSTMIERDETTGKPFRVIMRHSEPPSKARRFAIPDKEAGALKRLAKMMEAHPDLVPYHQGDPRGCCLYICRRSDIGDGDLSSLYTRGVAVCD